MEISKFKNQSSAQIINRKEVEVTAPDGEVFTVLCQIGSYINEETRKQELFWLEALFDKNFSDNKEQMINNIWRESLRFGIGGGIIGISSGTRELVVVLGTRTGPELAIVLRKYVKSVV